MDYEVIGKGHGRKMVSSGLKICFQAIFIVSVLLPTAMMPLHLYPLDPAPSITFIIMQNQ